VSENRSIRVECQDGTSHGTVVTDIATGKTIDWVQGVRIDISTTTGIATAYLEIPLAMVDVAAELSGVVVVSDDIQEKLFTHSENLLEIMASEAKKYDTEEGRGC